MRIDLNCDLGEGCPHDDELMRLITSANVACGFHAGDSATAHKALVHANQCGVRAGAHPGYADREHFGRRELTLSPLRIYQDCVYQIGALQGLAKSEGTMLTHVKPHGALYNQAFRDASIARALVDAASVFDLPIVGQPGSHVERECEQRCRFVAEGFADRRYRADGSLAPRSDANAFIDDPIEAVDQAKRLIEELGVQTLCVHGDNPKAIEFVRALREALTKTGIEIAPWC